MVKGCPEKPFLSTRRLLIICLSAFLAITFFGLWLQTDSARGFRKELKEHLREKLINTDTLSPNAKIDAIYILGGPPESFRLTFKKAAKLYHKGTTERILILHCAGITEYCPELQRNLTNDEWAILKLEGLGIPKKNVEAIPIEEEFFGTLSEAKGISRLIKKRGYKSVILISSASHTHRVKISFEKFLKDHNITFYIQGSVERGRLRDLLVEFVKLKIYKLFLVS